MVFLRAMRWPGLLICLFMTAVGTGCGAPSRAGYADKAGGATAPVVLTLATDATEDGADAPVLRYFVRAIAERSNRKLEVRIVYAAAGDATAFPELRVARMVRQGRFDLGWVGARSWDELGVRACVRFRPPS